MKKLYSPKVRLANSFSVKTDTLRTARSLLWNDSLKRLRVTKAEPKNTQN